MAAINCPGGPHVLPQAVREDHMFCHGQSGGTTFRGDQLKYDRPTTTAMFQSAYKVHVAAIHQCTYKGVLTDWV